MKQKIYILGIVSSMILMTGTIFKVNHWPGASTLLALGTVLLVVFFLPAALINHYNANGNRQYKLLYIVTYLTCAVIFSAMLFKIQHWPFAGYLVFIAVPFPFLVFLPVWLSVTSKIKNFDINNTVYILFLLALQAVFSVLLALNVTREKIDNSMQLTYQLSAFNQQLKTISGVAGKSAAEQKADEVLFQINECRQLIYNKTGLSGDKKTNKPEEDRYLDSRIIGAEVLITSEGVSPAKKLNDALNNFVTELGSLPGKKELAKQAQVRFGLIPEPGDDTPWSEKMFNGNYVAWILVDLDGMENYVRVIKAGVLN